MLLSLGRKSRYLRLILLGTILVSVLYLLITYEKIDQIDSPVASRLYHRQTPKLVQGLGNFEPKENENRDGPGERGQPHHLKQNQQNSADDSESEYGMNVACSDEISLDRSIVGK